ncbi:MAG TPA: hypothetical protein ENO00_03895 [Deltaproteobacteria bacterium]|nr:hypothetical protein [Deltaproteobacteria bacterium]
MDKTFKDEFTRKWNRFFPGAELPIGFYYTNEQDKKMMAQPPKAHRCIIGDLARVRKGTARSFDVHTIGCEGGRRYLGFAEQQPPDFEYFLSYGIPGKLEGERYKKSPELVREFMKQQPLFKAPAKYIVFKRWDVMEERDEPLVIIFFAPPDVLSGLFTLANYDEREPDNVIAPFGAGCGTIVHHPCRELTSDRPRAVMGMFDVSARPFVPSNVLSFAVPWPKFVRMADNMEESFLITKSWGKVKKRIKT